MLVHITPAVLQSTCFTLTVFNSGHTLLTNYYQFIDPKEMSGLVGLARPWYQTQAL
jgi:hypothetical protein